MHVLWADQCKLAEMSRTCWFEIFMLSKSTTPTDKRTPAPKSANVYIPPGICCANACKTPSQNAKPHRITAAHRPKNADEATFATSTKVQHRVQTMTWITLNDIKEPSCTYVCSAEWHFRMHGSQPAGLRQACIGDCHKAQQQSADEFMVWVAIWAICSRMGRRWWLPVVKTLIWCPDRTQSLP